VREAQFRVGTRSLADPVMATHHGEDYSRLAETAISTMYDAALADIERQYGRIEGGDMAVVGLGKLGSGEMTLQSDLDLILICDCPDFAALSDGAKPLDADRWFARAARRLMNGLSAPTSEGDLFEVDTRLRPSGNAGPLVTKFSSFVDYQAHQAWNWEHMALTRGRVLAAGDALREKVEVAIKSVLTAPRDGAKLADDAQDMRARLRRHQPQAGPFDIRRGDGGLVDVEFIAQCLQLAYGATHPHLAASMPLPQLLTALRDADCLDEKAHEGLEAAAACFLSLRQIASLCLEDNEQNPAPAIAALLLEALNEPDMSRLGQSIAAHRAYVAACFEATMTQLRGL
jgi:glutamate-ammonia-ligase adenylyltransferase